MIGKIVTANRLSDGTVVYLAPGGKWTARISGSDVARDAAAVARLSRTAELAVQMQRIVGPYVVDIEDPDGEGRPVRLRERIRSRGPTIPMGEAAES